MFSLSHCFLVLLFFLSKESAELNYSVDLPAMLQDSFFAKHLHTTQSRMVQATTEPGRGQALTLQELFATLNIHQR